MSCLFKRNKQKLKFLKFDDITNKTNNKTKQINKQNTNNNMKQLPATCSSVSCKSD